MNDADPVLDNGADLSTILGCVQQLKEQRQTHTEWAAHFEKHPELEAHHPGIGGAEFHRAVEARYTQMIETLTALADLLDGGVIVPVHDCPDCDNCGYYAVMDRQGNPEQVQCQFCYTVPNSRFNIEAMLTASEAK